MIRCTNRKKENCLKEDKLCKWDSEKCSNIFDEKRCTMRKKVNCHKLPECNWSKDTDKCYSVKSVKSPEIKKSSKKEYIIEIKGKQIRFESNFTLEEAISVLSNLPYIPPFVASLIKQSFKTKLTEKQIAWVHKFAIDFKGKKQTFKLYNKKLDTESIIESELSEKLAVAILKNMPFKNKLATGLIKTRKYTDLQKAWLHKTANDFKPLYKINVKELLKLFRAAKKKLEKPRIAFDNMSFTFDKNIINVINKNKMLAKITSDGYVWPNAYNNIKEIPITVNKFASNPKQYAQTYGLKHKKCSFCSLPLSDERSLKTGWGKVCAEHYGLPWGG